MASITLAEVLTILNNENLTQAIGLEYATNRDPYCEAVVGSYTLYMYTKKFSDGMLLTKNMRVFLNRVKSGRYGDRFNGLI